MLSQTAEYALRAVVFLAQRTDPAPLRVDAIAAALGIPANYLSKTLQVLVRARVLESQRGPHGGFRLAIAPRDLPLMRVVAPFDGVAERRHCLLGNPVCSDHTACAAHTSWKHTAEAVERFFRTTTLADIGGSPSLRPAKRPRRPA